VRGAARKGGPYRDQRVLVVYGPPEHRAADIIKTPTLKNFRT
jgi:hypothetical protein